MAPVTRAARLLLAAAFIGLAGCNAPLRALATATPTSAPPSAAPTRTPNPTAMPTPSSLDASPSDLVNISIGNLATTAVVVAPTSPAPTIFVGTWGNGVYASRDLGRSWRQVDSGKGQVTSLAVFPDDPRSVLVGTANLGVIRVTDDGLSLPRPSIGLSLFDVRSVAIDPARPAMLYAGAVGGVFSSPDGGVNWRLLGLGGEEVDSLFVDTAGGGTLFAGTNAHGVLATSDGGMTWSSLGPPSSRVNAVMAEPGTPAHLFAGTEGRGVARIGYSSTGPLSGPPGGSTGSAARTPADGDSGGAFTFGPYGGTVTDLKMDPSRPTTLYAASEYGVFKSTDNGDNWRLTGLASVAVYALAVDPANTSVVYATTRAQGVYRSLDGGETWVGSQDPMMADKIIYTLVVDPSAPNTVYAGGRGADTDGFASGDWGGGVFKSVDAGSTWTGVNAGLPEGWVYSLAVDPRWPGTLYAGTHSMGVYKSLDGGETWTSQSQGLVSRYHTSSDDLKIRSLAINPADPDQLLAGTWGGGSVFETHDGGVSWEYTGKGAEPVHVRSVAYNPGVPGLIYLGQREGGLLYKQEGQADARWQPFPVQAQGGWEDFSVVLAIAVSPRDGRTIFISAEGVGVLRSTDGGVSWQVVDKGLLATRVTAIVSDPSAPSHLFASTDGTGVFQSLDSGRSWSAHTWPTPWDWALGLALDAQSGRIFVPTESNGLRSIQIDSP